MSGVGRALGSTLKERVYAPPTGIYANAGKKWRQNDEHLLELWERGATAGEIAKQLGVSRSAVCGRLFRLREAADRREREERGRL